mmetsp:Transcript_501/g.1308  ORF Transcript_501/g.1308 Transcript_501/m.1308 type:complete len:417 (+) Transcript_501:1910-3160(+)
MIRHRPRHVSELHRPYRLADVVRRRARRQYDGRPAVAPERVPEDVRQLRQPVGHLVRDHPVGPAALVRRNGRDAPGEDAEALVDHPGLVVDGVVRRELPSAELGPRQVEQGDPRRLRDARAGVALLDLHREHRVGTGAVRVHLRRRDGPAGISTHEKADNVVLVEAARLAGPLELHVALEGAVVRVLRARHLHAPVRRVEQVQDLLQVDLDEGAPHRVLHGGRGLPHEPEHVADEPLDHPAPLGVAQPRARPARRAAGRRLAPLGAHHRVRLAAPRLAVRHERAVEPLQQLGRQVRNAPVVHARLAGVLAVHPVVGEVELALGRALDVERRPPCAVAPTPGPVRPADRAAVGGAAGPLEVVGGAEAEGHRHRRGGQGLVDEQLGHPCLFVFLFLSSRESRSESRHHVPNSWPNFRP